MEVFLTGPLKPTPHQMVLLLNKSQELPAMAELLHTQSCHQPVHHMFHLQLHGATTELLTPTHMLPHQMDMRP
jgi:hypothetical protein